MVNVSKHQLKEDVRQSLFRHFASTIARANQRTAPNVLGDLLTDSEELMLSKRFGAIWMTHQDKTAYEIAKKLHMSKTTVGDIQDGYNQGAYRALLKYCGRTKAEKEALWELIELISRGGMPKLGKRWKKIEQW